jgi:hypothetical protein
MMMRLPSLLALAALGIPLTACTPSAAPAPPAAPAAEAPSGEAEAAPAAASAPAEAEAAAEAAPAAAAPTGADTLANGTFTSPRFNIRFQLGERWELVEGADEGGPAGLGTSSDTVTLRHREEPGLRLVIGNSESIQLVDQSFANLTEDIGFENVRIVPDRTQTRTFNGVPGYRTEADAHLRGDSVPVYLIAQALDLPTRPTMVTVFVPGDRYYLFSDEMKAVLDSIEALNLRPE